MPRIEGHAPPPPPAPDPPAGAPAAAAGAPSPAPRAPAGAAPPMGPAASPDRIERVVAPPTPGAHGPTAEWRPLVAQIALSRGTGASAIQAALRGLAHEPPGEQVLLRATADPEAFAVALHTEAARRHEPPEAATGAAWVARGVVASILGERVRAAASARLTAKIKQVDHLVAVMRGQVHDPAALDAFFQRFGAVPATVRTEVLDAHHLGVAGHLTSDPTLYLFSRSAAGARARADLLATGHAEIVGTPVSLAELADGLETLRGELVAARGYAAEAEEPLLVFRPVVRRLAEADPRYAEAFALRRWVKGGAAIADPERYGFGVDAWNRLTGRDATLARALWASGVVDHDQVTHAREAWAAQVAGKVVGLAAGLVALPETATEELMLTVGGRAERALSDAAARLLPGQVRALVTRLGRQAAVRQLTAELRAGAEHRLQPAVRQAVGAVLRRETGAGAAQLTGPLVRRISASASNALSRAAARMATELVDALGGADPRTERVMSHLGDDAGRAVGTVLGTPGASLGGLLASYLAPERRALDDPATAITPGWRWDGGLPPGTGWPRR